MLGGYFENLLARILTSKRRKIVLQNIRKKIQLAVRCEFVHVYGLRRARYEVERVVKCHSEEEVRE